MGIIDKFLTDIAKKKLGADFEQRVMECLENQSIDNDEIIKEIIEHYKDILQLIAPNYSSVKINKNDFTTIYIDDIKYSLDDKSSTKWKKATEHRMAIEFLLADIGEDDSDVIAQVEKYLNSK